jgi:hypothetical protein
MPDDIARYLTPSARQHVRLRGSLQNCADRGVGPERSNREPRAPKTSQRHEEDEFLPVEPAVVDAFRLNVGFGERIVDARRGRTTRQLAEYLSNTMRRWVPV